MKRIGLTTETLFDGEAELIVLLLDNGFDRVHIRKPECSAEELARLLRQIPDSYYPRLILHSHFELAATYPIGGVHLNRHNPVPPKGFRGLIGRSCHSLEEVAKSGDTDYCFLSPIYDSISKPGYASHFPLDTLVAAHKEGILTDRVYALGGITPRHLPQLQELGFGGAVLLGYLWRDKSRKGIETCLRELS